MKRSLVLGIAVLILMMLVSSVGFAAGADPVPFNPKYCNQQHLSHKAWMEDETSRAMLTVCTSLDLKAAGHKVEITSSWVGQNEDTLLVVFNDKKGMTLAMYNSELGEAMYGFIEGKMTDDDAVKVFSSYRVRTYYKNDAFTLSKCLITLMGSMLLD